MELKAKNIETSELYKALNKKIGDDSEIITVDSNQNKTYRVSGKSAKVVTLGTSDGIEIEIWTDIAGKEVLSVDLESDGRTKNAINYIDRTDKPKKHTQIANAIAEKYNKLKKAMQSKANMAKQPKEAKTKDNATSKLEKQLQNLTKGSGKFLIFTPKTKTFQGVGGKAAKENTDIKIYSTLESAKKYKNAQQQIIKV